MKTLKTLACAAVLCATPFTMALADGHIAWKSVADQSNLAFSSVKKDTIGEVHTFENVSGTVSEEGAVMIKIDLASVETNIDIRNERMGEHVFKGAGEATISAEIDMSEVADIKPGDTGLIDVEAKLMLGDVALDVEAEMLVAPLSESRVLVSTANMVIVSTADLGIDGGVDMLQKLAKLPGITRATAITLNMVFEK